MDKENKKVGRPKVSDPVVDRRIYIKQSVSNSYTNGDIAQLVYLDFTAGKKERTPQPEIVLPRIELPEQDNITAYKTLELEFNRVQKENEGLRAKQERAQQTAAPNGFPAPLQELFENITRFYSMDSTKKDRYITLMQQQCKTQWMNSK